MPWSEVLLVGADLLMTFAVVKATLVAAAFGGVAWLLSRRAAALRATAWVCAFAALAVAPATAFLKPVWDAQIIAFPAMLWRVDSALPAVGGEMVPIVAWAAVVWAAVAAALLAFTLVLGIGLGRTQLWRCDAAASAPAAETLPG